jgi:hypothetical protein
MRYLHFRRMPLWLRIALTAVIGTGVVLPAAGCPLNEEPTSIRLLQPDKDTSVFIDGWDQGGKAGDEALVEKKPSGMWVIPLNAEYRTTKQGEFTVEIRLVPDRGYVIMNMNGVKTGKDHDDCLAEDEVYAFPNNDKVKLDAEKDAGPTDKSNDDCVLIPDTALGTTSQQDYDLVA